MKAKTSIRDLGIAIAAVLLSFKWAFAFGDSASVRDGMVEWTVASTKRYADPFNDVEVEVVFSRDGRNWRVPAFWRGGERWTVRFAPPAPGEYTYRLQSTDASNPDLNGHRGHVRIKAYSGANELLRHGTLKVSSNGRYFEHADGTPFYWLGDTWWSGLSSRLSWRDFRELTADRKAKGFTLIQLTAGLVPAGEDVAPTDPGCSNEGGPVWESGFKRINPAYFDYADRRIQHLLEAGIVPAIVGSWGSVLNQMGVAKMKRHWRYIIARYGAYPVLWILGGEVVDPPQERLSQIPDRDRWLIARGWTDVARYVRATDPYHHPLTVHEVPPPLDLPLQDESLTDFDMFQSGHFDWASIAVEVGQIDTHYARTTVVKPVVEGEIGYEKLGETHFENFQRAAFWLSMLNGAAGHTYGANGTWQAYSGDKPLHRYRYSFLSWREGMRLPGSYQIGLGAKLLRQYKWWRFEPHPQWITPRGTTLLEPRREINGFDLGSWGSSNADNSDDSSYPGGEWTAHHGNFGLPYAAGIPGEVRFIYIPRGRLTPPTVLGLEIGVRYHAYLWEPSLGMKIDLGWVERPVPGPKKLEDRLTGNHAAWADHGEDGAVLRTLKSASETNAVAAVGISSTASAGLVLRYHDPAHYIAALFAPDEHSLYLVDREDGRDGPPLGKISIPALSERVRLSAEVRDGKAAAAVTDGEHTYTTPIVEVGNTRAGSVGLLHPKGAAVQRFDDFELRDSPILVKDQTLQRSLYDAHGVHRGELAGAEGLELKGGFKVPSWDSFARDKHILLDAYRLERLPAAGDWLLVLEANAGRNASRD